LFGKKSKKNKSTALPEKKEIETSEAALPQKDEKELIAVLSAAVAAMMGTSPNGIVIRSYKRVSPSAWKRSGRDFQILNHF
jgi:hypothetical protein